MPHLRDRREDGVLHLLGNAIYDPTETRPQQCPDSCCGCCLAGAAHQSVHCMLEVDRRHQTCTAAAPWLRSSFGGERPVCQAPMAPASDPRPWGRGHCMCVQRWESAYI